MALLCTTNCSREYSLEGSDTTLILQPPAPLPDSGIGGPFSNLVTCTGCAAELETNQWSFQLSNTLLCGIIDTAILSSTREAFTFFGPSLCSLDSGLVITASLAPDKLDRNITGYNIPKAGMYYYDHVGNQHMLESRSSQPFRMHIISYNHQTKEISGSFSGVVYTADGKEVIIKGGLWKTHLY
ncbi:hypothetical protein [Cnuella takakiae]|nr:hypothetical protein [Cnuella takakiae]OLY92879.1 hypothetical protein BUE76_14020 [Cnuella takakiae]